MVMDRSLNRHSANTDNQLHLAALASFARPDPNTINYPQALKDFLPHARAFLPLLNQFLNGDDGDEVIALMRGQIQELRNDVRAILGDIDGALQNQNSTAISAEFFRWCEFGVHVEALVFALLPEQWDRLNTGAADWGTPEVFRANAHWVWEGLRQAENLESLWKSLRHSA